jgi:hypothetical protein
VQAVQGKLVKKEAEERMDQLTVFGLFAVTMMLVTYALESRSRRFTLGFCRFV